MSSIKNPFSIEAYRENVARHLNESMREQAEPIIQKALADIEKKMRERVALFVVTTLESQYSVERMGGELHITVRGFGNE